MKTPPPATPPNLPDHCNCGPLPWFELMLPRQLEIIYEINRRFLDGVRARHPGDDVLIARVRLIEEGKPKKIRLAHVAMADSHSAKGPAQLLKQNVVPDSQAHAQLGELFVDQAPWSRKAVLNTAASGRFSSDRIIAEYAKEIWLAEPCPIN